MLANECNIVENTSVEDVSLTSDLEEITVGEVIPRFVLNDDDDIASFDFSEAFEVSSVYDDEISFAL